MSQVITGSRIARYAITIPASGAPERLIKLLTDAGMPVEWNYLAVTGQAVRTLYAGAAGSPILGVKIDVNAPNSSTDRLAFVVSNGRRSADGTEAAHTATDATTHGQYVDAGVAYIEPADRDLESYLQSTNATPVSALAIVYLQ